MPLKTHTLRTKNHHEKMFQFVLLMGKSMFWKMKFTKTHLKTVRNTLIFSFFQLFEQKT